MTTNYGSRDDGKKDGIDNDNAASGSGSGDPIF